MAKDQNLVQSGPRRRGGVAAPAAVAAPPAVAKKRVSPVQFLREVRAEARKVTWTTWKETWITSVMVAIMVVLTALFFSGLDAGLGFLMRGVLKLAGAG
jgi:preprotein translocase subunit SecE